MDRLRIQGGNKLIGKIQISGAKNAALKLMAAAIMTDGKVTLNNTPRLADIKTMRELLAGLGVSAEWSGDNQMKIHAQNIMSETAPYDIVRKMRASITVLGPLLARHGHARVSLPGGCAIGARPVDLHIEALKALGAEIALEEGYVDARVPPGGLTGAKYTFPKVTVGGTENMMMAAVLAKGTTIIGNAAREPDVADLAAMLNCMGAKIEGAGTDTITITGVEKLNGCTHTVVADRIEAGTLAVAAVMTGGDLDLIGAREDLIAMPLDILRRAGAFIEPHANGVRVKAGDYLQGVDIMTEPFPGFPTDLQAQFMTMMTIASGASMITETIFENRFMHVPELHRMGADITIHHASALVRGVKKLKGAPVMATDLRASVSLVLAGLVAEGETTVNRIYHLDRGYEAVDKKLSACGAQIIREKDEAIAA
ncbi:MAG TPA: UDP-N-acetylglucosamine 1-carboxyvinyltransferase [Alphaproteobacteria bacterium]|nr:UDP-N-acetylglucosamine 1-carboxyvinyltransferase [Rhodospirillaceae bacterium]HRJ12431.1 UDP-N-acetylglucosamine 1-carboxyvinyltransferase [Alphaproteobacteria bacterium]